MSSLSNPSNQSINLKVPLQYGPAGAFDTNLTTIEAVADDLKVLLNTNYGERLMVFDFGANLRALVFSQGPNVAQQITDSITLAVDKFMPYVSILDIQVTGSDQDISVPYNSVNIFVKFTVGNTGLTGDVTVRL